MSKRKYVLVGGDPKSQVEAHPGGQVTASAGLVHFASLHALNLEIIDTTQSSFPVPPFRSRLARGFSRVRKLHSILQRESVEGVTIFCSFGSSFYERIFLCLLCRLYRVPHLLFIRSGHFIEEVRRSRFKYAIARLLLKIPFRIGAQGEPWREFYLSLGVKAQSIVIVRNWLSPAFQYAKEGQKVTPGAPLRFVFVGALTEQKGVAYLIEAVELLSDEFEFELTLIGDGTLRAEVEHRIRVAGLGRRIRFTGWLSSVEVRQHLRSAHIFVLPSLAEGFPNALLEAMASGLPAICSDVGAVSDSLHNGLNGFLIRPGSSDEIVAAMRAYLTDPCLVEAHSSSAIRWVREAHDLEKNCGMIFDIFSGDRPH